MKQHAWLSSTEYTNSYQSSAASVTFTTRQYTGSYTDSVFKFLGQQNITNAYVSGMREDLNAFGNELNYYVVACRSYAPVPRG